MALPLMPKATAVWLVDNTSLTFEQVSDFCGIHPLEVQAIADEEVAIGMQGMSPIASGELTKEEIERCSKDPAQRLKMSPPSADFARPARKGARYTPVSKRQDRPDAIAWLLKNCPELSDGQISKTIGTTKSTITAIREKSHWNSSQIKPRNPVSLGLCSEADLDKAIAAAATRAARAARAAAAKSRGAKKLPQNQSAETTDTPN